MSGRRAWTKRTRFCQEKSSVVPRRDALRLNRAAEGAGRQPTRAGLGWTRVRRDRNGRPHRRLWSLLRALETHAGLAALTQGAMAEALRQYPVGVQSRNCATVGGSLWGRFAFFGRNCTLVSRCWTRRRSRLHQRGAKRPLAETCWALPRVTRDILHEHVDPPQSVAAGGLSVPAEHLHRLPCAGRGAQSRAGRPVYYAPLAPAPCPPRRLRTRKALLAQGYHRGQRAARLRPRSLPERCWAATCARAAAITASAVCEVLVRRAACSRSCEEE